MATFPGAYLPTATFFEVPGLTAAWTGLHPRPVESPSLRDSVALTEGDYTSGQPSAILGRTIGGAYQFSFVEDYYNRIWLIPRSLDFGAVSNDTTSPFVMWNAHFAPSSLLSAVVVGDDTALTLNLPPLPASIGPLALLPLSVSAAQEGPADFSVSYNFSFSLGSDAALRVTGARARLWNYPVNWARAFSVTHEYRTDIIRSRSGREQRRAARQTPRKTVEFSSTIKGADKMRELTRTLSRWADRPFVVAEASRRAYCTTEMPAGSTTIGVESVPSWAVAGQPAVLAFGDQMSVARIDSVASGSITFSSIAQNDWPLGTLIYPGVTGLLSVGVPVNHRTNTVSTIDVRLDVKPGSELPPPPTVAAETHTGREVFLLKPNWGTPVQTDFERLRDEIDFGFGVTQQFRPLDFTTRVRKAAFLGRTHDEGEAILSFFRRMRGQAGEFFMPTWEFDIEPKYDLLSGTDQLISPDPAIARDYGEDPSHKTICVVLKDGTRLYRDVLSLVEYADFDGPTSQFSLAVPWATTIPKEEIEMICWMPVWRLASDSLPMEWLTDSVVQVQLSMRSLEKLA